MKMQKRTAIPAPPIHPLAALATIALDGFFTVFEILDPLMLVFISLGIGILGFLSTSLVQRYLAKDEWGAALAKGLVMGILAGVPYPVAGTAIGTPLLIWAGVHRWLSSNLPADGNNKIVDKVLLNSPALIEKENKDYED